MLDKTAKGVIYDYLAFTPKSGPEEYRHNFNLPRRDFFKLENSTLQPLFAFAEMYNHIF